MLWLWLGFFALVGMLLLLQRKASMRALRNATYWKGGWFVLGLAFVGLVYLMYEHKWFGAKLVEPSDRPGLDASTMFLSAYLLEYTLSFDSVVVISLQCELHHIPNSHQPRVVFWGLVGGILVRLVIITGTVCLAGAFTWMFYVCGALVLVSSLSALRPDEGVTPGESLSAFGQKRHMRFAHLLWRRGRLTDSDFTGKLWVVKGGRRVFTMSTACVLSIVLVHVVFALDSSAAILSISKTTFILVASNLLASIASLSWFSMLRPVENVHVPRKAIAALLGIVGVRLLTQNHVDVPHVFLLFAILVLGGVAFTGSLLESRRARLR